MIPILIGHDTRKVIGAIEFRDGQMFFEFSEDVRITSEMMFDIFGDVGFVIDECEKKGDVIFIRAGQIIEFSLGLAGAAVSDARKELDG